MSNIVLIGFYDMFIFESYWKYTSVHKKSEIGEGRIKFRLTKIFYLTATLQYRNITQGQNTLVTIS